MVSRVENADGQGQELFLPENSPLVIYTECLKFLERPGEYEITNVANIATSVQERGRKPSPDALSQGSKPFILMAHGETMELLIVRGGVDGQKHEVYSATVTNFIGE